MHDLAIKTAKSARLDAKLIALNFVCNFSQLLDSYWISHCARAIEIALDDVVFVASHFDPFHSIWQRARNLKPDKNKAAYQNKAARLILSSVVTRFRRRLSSGQLDPSARAFPRNHLGWRFGESLCKNDWQFSGLVFVGADYDAADNGKKSDEFGKSRFLRDLPAPISLMNPCKCCAQFQQSSKSVVEKTKLHFGSYTKKRLLELAGGIWPAISF